MRELRLLADRGRTVVVVTHSVLHLELCDHVLVMCLGGRMGYFGPPDKLLEFFEAEDYADVFDKVTNDADRWAQRYRNSEIYRRYVGEVALELSKATMAPVGAGRDADAARRSRGAATEAMAAATEAVEAASEAVAAAAQSPGSTGRRRHGDGGDDRRPPRRPGPTPYPGGAGAMADPQPRPPAVAAGRPTATPTAAAHPIFSDTRSRPPPGRPPRPRRACRNCP